MPLQTPYIVLSFLGILDAGYLAYKHLQKKPLVCPINHMCEEVTDSKWANMFGIRNEYMGLTYYIALFAGGIATILYPSYKPLLHLLLFGASVLGVIYSLFLVSLQAFFINNYCFYCMISALLTFLIFLNSAALFFG
ncbi:MAG: vitamin K epoxide reductase family protein [Candidatus Uhrbacteria bacterium]|nr:vitamin K epoxide reductase family protein [Candidatus Uhrbacteria bacterium]